MRGLTQHRATARISWKSRLAPTDLLLIHVGESGETAHFGDAEIAQSFCAMIGALKGFPRWPNTWAKLFRAPMGRGGTLGVEKRFSIHRQLRKPNLDYWGWGCDHWPGKCDPGAHIHL